MSCTIENNDFFSLSTACEFMLLLLFTCRFLCTKFCTQTVYFLQRLSRMDAWTQPWILRLQMPSKARLRHESLERDLTEKSHKTSFKGHTEIVCLCSSTSCFLLPLPRLYPLSLLHSYIRWKGSRHTRRKEGMGTFGSHSLEGLWDCLHLDELSVARGLFFPDGPSTVTDPLIVLPAPALGLQPHCVPSVPGRSQAGVLPLWVISLLEPLWSELMHQTWPRGGLLHQAATLENQWEGLN